MCPSSQPTANIALSAREDESIKEVYQLPYTLLLAVYWGYLQHSGRSIVLYIPGEYFSVLIWVFPTWTVIMCIPFFALRTKNLPATEPTATNNPRQSTANAEDGFYKEKKITHIYRLTAFASCAKSTFCLQTVPEPSSTKRLKAKFKSLNFFGCDIPLYIQNEHPIWQYSLHNILVAQYKTLTAPKVLSAVHRYIDLYI